MISKQEIIEACAAQKNKLLSGKSYRREMLCEFPEKLSDYAFLLSFIARSSDRQNSV